MRLKERTREVERERATHTHTDTHTHTHTDTPTQTHTDTDTHRHTHTHRHTQTHTHTHSLSRPYRSRSLVGGVVGLKVVEAVPVLVVCEQARHLAPVVEALHLQQTSGGKGFTQTRSCLLSMSFLCGRGEGKVGGGGNRCSKIHCDVSRRNSKPSQKIYFWDIFGHFGSPQGPLGCPAGQLAGLAGRPLAGRPLIDYALETIRALDAFDVCFWVKQLTLNLILMIPTSVFEDLAYFECYFDTFDV